MAYWIQNNKEELNAALTRSGLNAKVSGIHASGGSWQSSHHIRFSAGYAPDNDAHDEEVHYARHTFARTICLENGLPIETVSKMLGHRFISTTVLYAKVSKSKIAREMQPLMGSDTTRELRKALRVCPPRDPSKKP